MRHPIASPFAVLSFALLVPSSLHGRQAQGQAWNVTVPSPTAASLGKFGDVPVQLYTGLPDISVPIFTAKSRTLELPITLRYHASGIRVEEIGGWVGMGWSLDAGGVITRTVRGLVDETSAGYWNTGTTWYDPQNWPITPSATYLDFSHVALIQNMAQNFIDGEPDQFFANFVGRSTQFVMGPLSTQLSSREVRTIPYRKWRIEPTIGGGISQWVITTEDGTRYTFAAQETQRTLAPGPLSIAHGSSWYLTEMRSPGGDVITLHYHTASVRHTMGFSGENRTEVGGTCPSGTTQVPNSLDFVVQRLDSIVTAQHTITFTTSLRTDALDGTTPQEHKLDRITVKTPAGVVLRQFQLDYDYSIGNPGRLTLKQVSELDRNGNSLPPTLFAYASPVLPARTSMALDHWGYFNGKTTNSEYYPPGTSSSGISYPGADRQPDSTSMKAGVLTKITYPTGGFNEFFYEPHDYGLIWSGGQVTDSGPPQTAQVISSNSFPGVRTTNFTVGGLASVPVTFSLFISLPPPVCQNCPYGKVQGVPGAGPWFTSTTTTISLAPRTYTLEASEAGSGTFVSLGASWRELVAVPRKMAGGLRIAELRTADAMGNVTTRKFKYVLQNDPTRSSGLIEAEPDYDYNYEVFSGANVVCKFYSRSFMSQVPLGGGSPVFYSEATVWDGTNGEFGKTRERFFVGGQPALPPGGLWPFHRRTNLIWRLGDPVGTDTYDASTRIQQSVSASVMFPLDTVSHRQFRGLSLTTWQFPGPGGESFIGFSSMPFVVESGWKYRGSETITVYDTTGTSSFGTTKTFIHANPRHAQLTELIETNSDGTQRITRLKYPADYAVGSGNPEAAALTAMQGSAHIHNAIVERSVSSRVGVTEKVVQAELTTFKLYPSGSYLPFQRFVLNSPTPIP